MMTAVEYSNALSKELKRLKKELGCTGISQNYKGTGSQAMCRQLWCRWENTGKAVLDIWLDKTEVRLGGVVYINPKGVRVKPHVNKIPFGDQTPQEVYEKVKTALTEWLG